MSLPTLISTPLLPGTILPSVAGWAKSASCIYKPSDSLMLLHHHAHSKDGASWGLLGLISDLPGLWGMLGLRVWGEITVIRQLSRALLCRQRESGGIDVVHVSRCTLMPAWVQKHPTLFQQPSCSPLSKRQKSKSDVKPNHLSLLLQSVDIMTSVSSKQPIII